MAGKRSIFEEVGAAGVGPTRPAGGMIEAPAQGARGAIRLWLVVIFVMVAAMVMLGGLTRLSEAGLSITEWRPVLGAVPPLNAADWAGEFGKYQDSPQYRLMNAGMTLDEFKAIYWWEWAHRQLGRLVGLVWAAGFVFFAATRRVPAGWTRRLLGLGVLGGVQGVIGWWMVSSGLTGAATSVASWRLAVHLGLAFVVLGLCAGYIFLLGRRETDLLQAGRNRERRLRGMATGLMHLLFLQIVLGALVAGIDAGRNYPTWPDMNGAFFPEDGLVAPLLANAGLMQFLHRMTGYLLFGLGVMAWARGRASAYQATRAAFSAVLVMLGCQVALGVWTALTAATLHVAITHQIGAVILWVLVIRARHMAAYPVQGSIKGGTA